MQSCSGFRNAALIYNPCAGRLRGRGARKLEKVVDFLGGRGIHCELRATSGPGTATVLAQQEVEDGRDLIIVCGGDGTVNEVVNGMAGSHVPLALFPAGTANVLAKELGLPWEIRQAADCILTGEVRRIALGRAGERYFIAVAGVGADANIVYHLQGAAKLRLGILSYWLEAFCQLVLYDFPEFTAAVGDEEVSTVLLIVSRTRHYGGPVQITRGADFFGDEFEVCAFPRRSRLTYLLYFLAQFVGLLESFPAVRFLRAQKASARSCDRRVHVQVDGELAGELPMDFTLIPNALSLVLPRRRIRRSF